MTFLTDFADQAVVLPLVAVVAALLMLQGWQRGAVVWLCAIGGTFAVLLALKLTFLGCASVFGSAALRSPSGHVAAATAVCGGVAAILGGSRRTVALAALIAGFGIGLTRIGLHVHSWPEVGIGATVGVTGALAVAQFAGPPPQLRIWPMVLTAACVAALLHGRHLGAEQVIRQAAASVGWCAPVGPIQLQR